VVLRQPRQDRSQRDTEYTEWKLDEPVRVVKPADAAREQERSDQRIEQNADLRDRRPEQRGRHELQDSPHAFVPKTETRSRQQVEPPQERQLEGELHDAGREHAGRETELGPRQHRTHPAGKRDHDDVQQHGRERGDGEPPMRVQHAARERRQRDEQDVGEREPQHVGREREAPVFAAEARREQQDQCRRRDDADRRDGKQGDAERARDAADELTRLRMAPVRAYRDHGTNACENAPSANRRRSRFGILNATANASMTGPDPNQAENAISRASPVMRDNSVMQPTTEVAVSRRS
jgi:hypothetical protein